MISNYEHQYMDALKKIYYDGFSDGVNERTGKETKRIPGAIIQVDVGKEFPILKSKRVYGKTALQEILWIWRQHSNNIHDLKAHIWDAWADEDGSIGKAYGYQISKPVKIYTDPIHKTPESYREYEDQAHYVLEYLKEFPTGRWGTCTLWNVDDLSAMNLVPCVHTSTWNLDGGRLNCVLDQRSGDMPYGVPFNTTQYAELMILFARHLNVEPGILTHVIADAHIYDNQMEGVAQQIDYYDAMVAVESNSETTRYAVEKLRAYDDYKDSNMFSIMSRIKEVIMSEPKFLIEGEDTSFFTTPIESMKIVNYNDKTMGKVDFGEIAV